MPFLRRLGLAVLAAMVASPVIADEKAASPKGKTEYILAVSWQPGFCETRPKRKECAGQTAERYDATHFSLHGLWPMKKSYCGVAADIRARDKKGDWLELPQLAMAEETAAKLLIAMPGTQSGLDRHQWLRSGTCQGGTAQDYFAVQLRLLDELNGSAVRTPVRRPPRTRGDGGRDQAGFRHEFRKGCRRPGADALPEGGRPQRHHGIDDRAFGRMSRPVLACRL